MMNKSYRSGEPRRALSTLLLMFGVLSLVSLLEQRVCAAPLPASALPRGGEELPPGESFWPQESAFSEPGRSWALGVVSPLQLQLDKHWWVELHPIMFFLFPSISIAHRYLESGDWALQGSYGVSAPSLSYTNAPPLGVQGYLSPRCQVAAQEPDRSSCPEIPLTLAHRYQLRGSYHRRDPLTLTLEAEGALFSGEERPPPLETYPFLELPFASLTHGARFSAQLRHDKLLSPWLRAAVEAGVTRLIQRGSRSPWFFRGYLGLDFALTSRFRASLGASLWESDQGAYRLLRDEDGYHYKESIRSLEFYPSFDLRWRFGERTGSEP